MQATIEGVKRALGITGDYQDDTITEYFNEVVCFLKASGVAETSITNGVVARGVSDLWGTEGKLSSYFIQRATQLSYKG